jgi:hypothetical protein
MPLFEEPVDFQAFERAARNTRRLLGDTLAV